VSATAAVRRGQVAAVRLMVDTCVIRRRGPEVTNPDTGVVTPTWTQIYNGPCKLQESAGFGAAGTEPQAGEHKFVLQGWRLHLPIAETGPTDGDVAEVTTAGVDPDLVGRRYRLGGDFAKTFATARRIQVEEVVS
jgi:hypothetical protein